MLLLLFLLLLLLLFLLLLLLLLLLIIHKIRRCVLLFAHFTYQNLRVPFKITHDYVHKGEHVHLVILPLTFEIRIVETADTLNIITRNSSLMVRQTQVATATVVWCEFLRKNVL